jgi:hypothetical protein
VAVWAVWAVWAVCGGVGEKTSPLHDERHCFHCLKVVQSLYTEENLVRKQLASLLMTCGVLLVLFGGGGWNGATVVRAQSVAPQPSPRPPANFDGNADGGDVAPATGRLTGTVIDSATGAPVPGATVQIGNETVTADANGNYDHWLAAGSYNVTAAPGAEPLVVTVVAGGTTVQHLTTASTPVPAEAPLVAAPARAAVPVEVVAEPTVQAKAAAVPEMGPVSLPHTGLDSDGGWLWLAAGLGLLLFGWLLWGRPVARLAPALGRSSRLPADFDAEELLEELLVRASVER